MAGSLAHTFLWKHDEEDERKCKLLAGIVKAVIMAALTVVAAVIAPAAPAVAGAEAGVASGLEKTAVVAARSSPWRFAKNAATGVNSYWKSGGAEQAQMGLSVASNFPVNVSSQTPMLGRSG